MEQKKTTSLWYFLGIWFCLNLLQSYATELGHDEAYYWIYSQHPAWGYFDHPPMIAWWITLGDTLLHNELGVRFWTVAFSTLSIYLLYQLAQPKRDGVFFSLCFSALVLHIACFIVTPDSPLLFFTVVVFFF
jgi:4-amino-4-deoxy-L-arabinose transferase-like glycosyltransferase